MGHLSFVLLELEELEFLRQMSETMKMLSLNELAAYKTLRNTRNNSIIKVKRVLKLYKPD